jgi:hypothetical protein
VYGAIVAKSCAVSQGQPPLGARNCAMIARSRSTGDGGCSVNPVAPGQFGVADREEVGFSSDSFVL